MAQVTTKSIAMTCTDPKSCTGVSSNASMAIFKQGVSGAGSLRTMYPYLILDARYEKVREDGAVHSQAVLVAIGINWEGRRNILAVELASRESL
jgi:Transposase, Mutator family